MGKDLKLQDNGFCFVCGRDNPNGLKLIFTSKNGKVTSEFTPSIIHQGYQDITHGGIISTILDEAMIYAAFQDGLFPITAELTVRFKKPLMIGQAAIIEAEIVKRNSRLVTAQARLVRKEDSSIIAEAYSKIAIKS